MHLSKAIMTHFFYKLIPPMSSGSGAGNSRDGLLIASHDDYMREQMEKGNIVVFGDVADPNGSFCMAILRLENEEDAGLLIAGDPAITAGADFEYELFAMPSCSAAG